MRPSLAVLLALALAAAAPATQAQDTGPAPVLLLEDPPGDVEAYGGPGTPVAAFPGGTAADGMDLRSLLATETETDILVSLQAQSIEPGALSTLALSYEVFFRHVDRDYVLRMDIFAPIGGSGNSYEGRLYALDPADDFGAFVAEVPVTPDLASQTMTAAIPRLLLLDGEGAAPFPGRALDQFRAAAGYLEGGTFSINGDGVPTPYVTDHMPDEGFGQVPLPIALGLEQRGTLRLSSDEPFRASNGEASTFVFRVNATNLAPEEQVAQLAPVGTPPGWDVRAPGLVRLGANETVEVPIVVRTAFSHAHGSATAFTLQLESQDGGSVGRVQLGLRYPKVAQPAGHHNDVYLHNLDFSSDPLALAFGTAVSALGGGDAARVPYFNTAPPEEDEADAGTPVTGQYCAQRLLEDNDTVGSSYCWWAPLSPGLEMGLDFDLGATGEYSVPIHSLYPQPGARVRGQLNYYPPPEDPDPNSPAVIFFREPIVLARLLPSEAVDLLANEDQVFTGAVVPTEDGDLVPYVRGASLELQIELLNARPDNFYLGPKLEPQLSPGAFLRLPLLEYEDPVDEAYGVASSVHLVLDGEGHRDANPGDTVVYSVTLHNADGEAHDFALALVGSNHAWGRVVGDNSFRVAGDGSRTLTIAVTVPADALDQDRADLVLEAASKDDLTARALVRLVTTVDTDAEHEDQAGLLGEAARPKDTPPAGAGLLALSLAALGLARRRRDL